MKARELDQWKSDDELMESVVRRDAEALEIIYSRYESLLRTVILAVIHDQSDVDDVLHDVMLQVWDQGHRYVPGERGLRGFLVTLARRRALDRVRRKTAYRRATEHLKKETGNPLIRDRTSVAEQIHTSDLAELLNRAIQILPVFQKEVIQLTFFHGMSQREIAASRSISLGTVKTRLHLAQRKLYQFLLPIQNKI
jgi:RNA polymerase sigma-70 factor (ECF subfamily)